MIVKYCGWSPSVEPRHRILLRPAPHIRACCGRLSLRCDPHKPHAALAPVADCRSIRRERSRPYIRVGHGHTRLIEVYYGHLNPRTGGPLITDRLQKKSYGAVSAALPFASDPAKITVGSDVSWLPSPIKAARICRRCSRQRDERRSAAPEGHNTKRVRPGLRLGRERGSL
jgi:hypothetical protein